ncbi:hypothetical protein TEA_010255 [Camellia sinensis var. sinensis]|uniref:FAD/NAD(P)-binding domain-containing protein n=1 Tax=Camellia sinensis var. sinensis TaxID=542762 RepID=A0A4S4DVW2_CAMSN|nr:hypothetical protein TEA_010255 [Camellia sinensis var. sinensis]
MTLNLNMRMNKNMEMLDPSDKEDGGDRKKLRLSKDQSAVLEESLKLSTLNPISCSINKAAKLKGPFLCGCNQVVEIEVFIVFLLPCNNGSLLYGVDAALIATGRGPFTKGLGLENINVVTQRGFVLVDERMQVIDANGNLVPHLYCIDVANEKMILAYAASAQRISIVEQVSGKDHVLNHLSIPAACFTHLEISNGWTHRAKERAEIEGFEISVAKTSFKPNTKALAENEGEGLAKSVCLFCGSSQGKQSSYQDDVELGKELQSIHKLNGSIDVIQSMTQLNKVYLYCNNFSGTLPDISRLTSLKTFSVRDNNISGPTPKFNSNVTIDMNNGSNNFFLSDPRVACDPLVNTLLSIAESVDYPIVFAENRKRE